MPKKVPLNFKKYRQEASKECFICNIANGGNKRKKHTIFYEDNEFIAFLNNYPTQEAQTLVCPKKHYSQIFSQLSTSEYNKLMNLARRVGLAIQKIIKADRMYIASLGSNQVNSHIHIHLLPISSNLSYEQQQLAAFDHKDGIYRYTPREKKQLTKLIQKELDQNKD